MAYRKRKSYGNSLTGGTMDVNPQWFNLAVATVAANTTLVQSENNIPNLQYTAQRMGAVVMEILKVFIEWPALITDNPDNECAVQLTTTTQTALIQLNDPHCILRCHLDVESIATATSIVQSNPKVYDLTDGAGHGVLFAGDVLFFGAANITGSNAQSFYCKVLYRWKRINITEYIGIVQGSH